MAIEVGSGFTIAYSTVKVGDLNGDGLVDSTDVTILLAEYGISGAKLPADINHDGTVNIVDLSILLSSFPQPVSDARHWRGCGRQHGSSL